MLRLTSLKKKKLVFNFVLNSFPESILVDDSGIENENLLALLALIAKAVGNSRELITNLATAHSVEELYNKIENSYFAENNKELLLLLIKDLDIPMFKNLTREEQLALLSDSNLKNLVLNSYLLTKDRGTDIAIKNIIDFTLSKTLADKDITITDIANQPTITNGNGQVVIGLPLVSLTGTPVKYIEGLPTTVVDNQFVVSHPKQIVSKSNNLVDNSKNLNKEIDFSTGTISDNPLGVVSDYVYIKDIQYIASVENIGSLTFRFYDIDKNYIGGDYTDTAYYIRLRVLFSEPTIPTTVRFKINLGTVALPYQPYAEHIYPLGDGVDLPMLPNGVGDKYNSDGSVDVNVGKVTFTGASSERWFYHSTDGDNIRFDSDNNNLIPNSNNKYTDRTKYIISSLTLLDDYWININNLRVIVNKNKLVGYGGFVYGNTSTYAPAIRAYLTAVNIEIYYQLATPTTAVAAVLPTYIDTYTGGTIIVDNGLFEEAGVITLGKSGTNLEQLIDFSFNNYNKITDPLNPDYFIESASGYDMYNIYTDNITYKTLMNHRPAGIFYNILIEYIANKLFTNMTGDEVIIYTDQVITDNIVELKNIISPIINIEGLYSDNNNNYTCAVSYANQVGNKFAPLVMSISLIDIATSFPVTTKNIPVNQNESGWTSFNFTPPTVGVLQNQYRISAHLTNKYSTKYASEEVEQLVDPSIAEVIPGTLNAPLVILGPNNTLDIESTNTVPVDVTVSELWTYQGEQYLIREYSYNDLSLNKHMFHPINNPGTMYNLDVSFEVSFTFNSTTSTADTIGPLTKAPGTQANKYPDTVVSAEVIQHSISSDGYTPYIQVYNTNSNYLNYYVYYEYLSVKDDTSSIVYGGIPAETSMIFVLDNIIKPGAIKTIHLDTSPRIDGSLVYGRYVVVFGHENSSTAIKAISNTDFVIPSRPIIIEDLHPVSTTLTTASAGYQTESYGFINIKTSINAMFGDNSKFNLVGNFVVHWIDSVTGVILSSNSFAVGSSGTNNNEFSKTGVINPYNRRVNAMVEPMVEVRVLATGGEYHVMPPIKTITNISNNYGGI